LRCRPAARNFSRVVKKTAFKILLMHDARIYGNRATLAPRDAVAFASSSKTAVVAVRLPREATTTFERILLTSMSVLIPLEGFIPDVGGFSVIWFWFAVIAGYVFGKRLRDLRKVWLHPVFLAAYVMLALDSLIELSHPSASFYDIGRIAQMILGAVFVASLCRDREALQASVYGYILAGLWLSVLLLTNSYHTLSGATATDFRDAGLNFQPIPASFAN